MQLKESKCSSNTKACLASFGIVWQILAVLLFWPGLTGNHCSISSEFVTIQNSLLFLFDSPQYQKLCCCAIRLVLLENGPNSVFSKHICSNSSIFFCQSYRTAETLSYYQIIGSIDNWKRE